MPGRVRALATIAAVAGLLLGSIPAAPTATARRVGAIKIASIYYNPPGNDTGSNASLNGELIMIKNTGGVSKALSHWTVRDRSGHTYHFPVFHLAAGASVRLRSGAGADTSTDLYWGSSGYIWNNDGDTAKLKRPTGVLVDRCSYDGSGLGTLALC